jgi:hypothetical protein
MWPKRRKKISFFFFFGLNWGEIIKLFIKLVVCSWKQNFLFGEHWGQNSKLGAPS